MLTNVSIKTLTLALALSASPAFATTWHISPGGSDTTGSGSAGNPWKTIQRGVTAASAGDIITVADGTYGRSYWNGSTDVNANSCGSDCSSNNGYASPVHITSSGTSGNPITIVADNPCTTGTSAGMTCHATLTGELTFGFSGSGSGSGGNPVCNCADTYFEFSGSASWWVIQGFDITAEWWDGIFINSGSPHDIVFKGNHFEGIGNRVYQVGLPGQTQSLGIVGVFIGTGSNFTYDGNIFNNIGRLPSPGSNCGNSPPAPPPQVTYNDDYSHDHGLYLFNGPHKIINNIFYGNAAGWNIQTAGNNTSTIWGNTLIGGANPCKDGTMILYLNNTVTIQNNIMYNGTNYAIDNFGTTQTGSLISFNLIFGSSSGLISISAGITQSNNPVGNPNFISTVTPDYHLTFGSPAIGLGTTIADSIDITGAPRPTPGGGYDKGAYQFISGVVSPNHGVVAVF